MTGPNVYITTNESTEARTASFLDHTVPPKHDLGPETFISYFYSTPPSPTLTSDADLHRHLAIAAKGPPYTFFPVAGGTGIGYMNFGPNPKQEDGHWHRTETVDYIVMLEGELELKLDDGETKVVKMGDVVVQRAPMHQWKNLSRTESARYVCVAIGVEGAVEGQMKFPGQK